MRPAFLGNFRRLQRGKALESLVFMDWYYLLALDGTGFFSSEKLSFALRLSKNKMAKQKMTVSACLWGCL